MKKIILLFILINSPALHAMVGKGESKITAEQRTENAEKAYVTTRDEILNNEQKYISAELERFEKRRQEDAQGKNIPPLTDNFKKNYAERILLELLIQEYIRAYSEAVSNDVSLFIMAKQRAESDYAQHKINKLRTLKDQSKCCVIS